MARPRKSTKELAFTGAYRKDPKRLKQRLTEEIKLDDANTPKPEPAKEGRAPGQPHVDKALGYCRSMIAGEIPACKLAIAACQRHLDDLDKALDSDSEFMFDAEKAELACVFVEKLPHVKGKWARRNPKDAEGHKIRLEPWQCFFICSIFGWVVRATGMRRFMRGTLFVPRKNAKSTMAAAIGMKMFADDGEPGAEVYCGAGSEKQAWEVFGPARQFAVAEPKLAFGYDIAINAKSLVRQVDGALSKFEPVIGKPGDGASPHCAIIDEYHEHATSEQHDTFKTGMGAREQPLLLIISTAGLNIAGPCRDHWDECEKILQGTIQDERHFAIIYTIDDPEDWQGEDKLRIANPNWGVSVLSNVIIPDMEGAMRDARKQGAFKTKHLNIWVTANMAFFHLDEWKKCRSETLNREDFHGKRCAIGGDLSSKVDLVAVAQTFKLGDVYSVFARYYLPEARANLPENQHYRKWAIEGWLTLTPGNIVDLGQVRDELIADCKTFEVAEIALDPFQATLLINELMAENAPAVEFRQTVLQMSEPMKGLDAAIRSGKIRHDGNPITAWCLSNVVAHLDAKENVYPRKERAELKIDGAVALIMSFSRAQLAPVSNDTPGVLAIDM
jgi:phage terminase large subunit-like protein